MAKREYCTYCNEDLSIILHPIKSQHYETRFCDQECLKKLEKENELREKIEKELNNVE